MVFLLVSALLPAVALASGADLLIWQTRAPLPNPVAAAAMGQVGNKMYIIGGTTDLAATNPYLGTSVFDVTVLPPGNPWSTGVALPSPGRWQAASATVGNTIYILGGKTGPATVTDSVLAYDTSGAGSIYSVGTLSMPRAQASACVIGTKIFVIGGVDASGNWVDTIDVFDTAGSGPSQNGVAQLLADTQGHILYLPWNIKNSLVFASGNSFYSYSGIGTNGPETRGWKVDLANTQYGFLAVAPLFNGHGASGIRAASNGKVYFPAGINAHAATQEYDIAGNTWALTPSLPNDRRDPCVAVMQSDQLVVIGGWIPLGSAVLDFTDVATIVPAQSGSLSQVSSGGTANLNVSNGTVSVGFPSGSSVGTVTVSTVQPVNLPPGAGIGFRISGQVYDISTNVTGWGPGNPLTITLPYLGAAPIGNTVVVRHWTGMMPWVQIPCVVGGVPGAKTVTFQTTSLSPFVIEEPEAITTNTPASSPWSIALAGALGLGLMVIMRRRWAA
jgi:N-acetylneuraminic acid mutarotase